MTENLMVWTSDWHFGRQLLSHSQAVAAHIASLEPALVIDTGDCKDGFGPGSAPQLQDYLATVGPLNASCLPGNHDENADYHDPGSSTNFSLFDVVKPAPYHFTRDWEAPQVRVIGFHSYIHHSQDGYAGFFHVDASELEWLEDQLAALPEGWQAIVCSHAPANPVFGNFIGSWFGGTQLLQLLAANQSKIAAYLNGHRHQNMQTSVLDGITHFNGPGVSYTQGNGHGGFAPVDYDPQARTLTFRYHLARAPFAAYPGYTPFVIQLPGDPEPTPLEQALAELKLTTVGYKNKYWMTPPVGTHWRNALDILETV